MIVRLHRCLWIFIFAFLFLKGTVFAQTKIQGLAVSADNSDRDTDNDTWELVGNVQITFKDQHLTCARAKVNERSKTIDAVGSVVITSPQATIAGERVLFDYESNTALIYNGYVQSGPALFEGSVISKSGESEYGVDSAKFTTCQNCPETWSFTGEKIRAQLGGYAFIKNSFLRAAGVRIFWLPYLIVPLKSDRQTGLLTPGWGTSDSGGFEIWQSLFWVIDRNQDATFTLKDYQKRGTKGLVNYRYLLSETSGGELDFGTLRDRVFSSDNERVNRFRSPSQQNTAVNRWFTKYEHYIELPEGFTHRLMMNNASDLQYPKDFPLETLNHGDPAMENRMSLTKNKDVHHFSVDSSYYINLLQADPLASNNDAVHRLPELRYSHTLSKIGDTGFLFTADLNSAQFVRSEFGYDDMLRRTDNNNRVVNVTPRAGEPKTECFDNNTDDFPKTDWHNNPKCVQFRDGKFNADRDLIRTGQRFDAQASIVRPFKIGENLDLIPKLGFRTTNYQFNITRDDSAVGQTILHDRETSRQMIRAELAARSVFSKIYGDTASYRGDRWKHEIQPEVTFRTIPWINQPNHMFFGSTTVPYFTSENVSDSDLNSDYGLQFDYFDRIYDRKVVTVSLINRVISKRWLGTSPTYRQDFSWRLSQSYDYFQAESNLAKKQPLSDLRSEINMNLDKVSLYQKASYYPKQQVTTSYSRMRYTFDSGDFAQLIHENSYGTIIPTEELAADTRPSVSYTLSAKGSYRIADFIGKVTYNPQPGTNQSYLSSYGYGVVVNLPGNCLHLRLTHYKPSGGENNFQFSFDFNWDGSTKSRIQEAFLDIF